VEDEELKLLLDKLINSRELHGNLHDILSFFPKRRSVLKASKTIFSATACNSGWKSTTCLPWASNR
jgi:hypothetical protein